MALSIKQVKVKSREAKQRVSPPQPRPVIEPNRKYDRRESVLACGAGINTIVRAFENGYLKAYRIGRCVMHSGQHLLDWLGSGGKTGCHKTPEEKGGAR